MKRAKIFGYSIIALSGIFIAVYLTNAAKEVCLPFEGLGFSYKTLSFFILKLIYAILLLIGGVFSLKKNRKAWTSIVFASTGILISWGWAFFCGYIFRSPPLDYFLLEIISTILLVIFLIRPLIRKFDIPVPPKNWFFTIFFILINFGLTFLAWFFVS